MTTNLFIASDTSNHGNSNPLVTGSFLSMSDNLLSSGGGNSFTSVNTRFGCSSSNLPGSGNIVVGNGEWLINQDINPQKFAADARATIDNVTSRIFSRLYEKFVSEGGNNSTNGSLVADGNPFADGGNPFGEGNLPEIPLLDFLRSRFGENFPMPSGEAADFLPENFPNGVNNSFGGSPSAGSGNSSSNTEGSSSNLFTGGRTPYVGNPFAGGRNPLSGGGSPSASSGNSTNGDSDRTTVTGGNPFSSGGNPFGGGSSTSDTEEANRNTSTSSPGSIRDTLSGALDFVLDLSGRFNRMGSNSLFGDGGNSTPLQTPDDLLRLFRTDMTAFGRTVEEFTDFVGDNNPFAGAVGENTSASGNNELFKFLGWALDGLLPLSGTPNVFQTPPGELPLGYGNRDFGDGNAAIGNANRDYGDFNASIGNNNWNWDSSTNNATIGNGNWNWISASDNKTVGNGNWYLDHSSDNSTFGNGNWNFGSDNSTLGNGNFNFGTNNLVIGNGNWVFTNNSIVIGNGNWSVVMENTPSHTATISGLLERLDTLILGMEIKGAIDNLVESTVQNMGSVFYGLTDDLSASGKETFNRVILSPDAEVLEMSIW